MTTDSRDGETEIEANVSCGKPPTEGLLDADVEVEQEPFNGVWAELAHVDRNAVNEDPARHEHPDAGNARDDCCHLLELGPRKVDEGWEIERHEVAPGWRSVTWSFGGEQFLEPAEERVMERTRRRADTSVSWRGGCR